MAKKDEQVQVSTVDEFPVKKADVTAPPNPSSLIFKYVPKPDHFSRIRAINVFDNRWRVNIYSHATVNGIQTERMSASYFVIYSGATKSLQFVLPKL